jgi:hypothetical protein
LERRLETVRGRPKVMIVADEESVTAIVVWSADERMSSDRVERRARVEWQPWRFGSRRPWVCCQWCGRRCLRLFLATEELVGSLICHSCAGVRYRSQDLTSMDRLFGRRDSILNKLGVEAPGGELVVRIPRRPKGMHYRTYDRLIDELFEIEDQLELEQQTLAENALARFRTRLLNLERRTQRGR